MYYIPLSEMVGFTVLLFCVAAVSALPADVVLRRPEGLRFDYVQSSKGLHLVDLWTKASDLEESARYNPDNQNVYHLFTRQNPTVSQPLLIGSAGLLGMTNFDARRRTVVLLHGWFDNASSAFNNVLVPAFLSAEDVNIIIVDWSAGSGTVNYIAAVANTVTSGQSVARFINWLNQVTETPATNYHIVGHSLGGHQAGIVGRNVEGAVAYITALDPMFALWNTHNEKFRANDGAYTEVIHTNAGRLGYVGTLGDVDFYPNGGADMPGCNGDQDCNHHRSFHYLAESLISGGFTGRRCGTYVGAMTNNCLLLGRLQMGGLVPKTGSSGIFRMETNAAPPFSQG